MPEHSESTQKRVTRVLIVAQFVLAVDFMLLLPLGPDLVGPLGFPASHLGWVVAAYTITAAVAGVVGAFILDRYDRRSALVVSLVGLAFAAFGASLAKDLTTLMLARTVAGCFGGPSAALSLSALTDAVPVSSRGQAVGKVMGGNALGAILGVPIGLWFAETWRWEAAFWVGGTTALIAAVLVALGLPRLSAPSADVDTGFRSTLQITARREVLQAYLMIFVVMMASFLLTPNLSAFLQYNLSYPRSSIAPLYFVAGAVSFITMRLVGLLVDRKGALLVGVAAALGLCATVVIYLILPEPLLPVHFGFVLLLVSLSSRNVAIRTVTTQIPRPQERARFLSLQSSVRYLAAAIGSVVSAALLETDKVGNLIGMDVLGWVVIGASVGVLPLLAQVEAAAKKVAADEAS